MAITPVPHGTITWSVTGGGTVDRQNGPETMFTAPFLSPTVTADCDVLATFDGGPCDVPFKVIPPSSVIETNIDGTLAATSSPLTMQYRAWWFVTPDTVSFYNISIQEGDTSANATGYFTYQEGKPHIHGNPIKGSMVVIPDKGTLCAGYDTVGGGTTGPVYSAGTFLWPIPLSYIAPNGNSIFFTLVRQTKTLAVFGTTATLTIEKIGSSGSCHN